MDSVTTVDMRTKAFDINPQEVCTICCPVFYLSNTICEPPPGVHCLPY